MPQLISLFDVQPILETLSTGQLILTPNQRLASRIRAAYAIYCSERGQKVVDTPAVYSLSQWLDRCWQQLLISASPLAVDRLPLSVTQQQLLWEQIVSGSEYGTALLRPAATAVQAISAYRHLIDWQQDVASESLRALFAGDEDSAAFLGWVDEFERRCKAGRWLPPARIAERVLCGFEQGLLKPVAEVLTIGFEDIAPLHRAVIRRAGAWQELGEAVTGGVNNRMKSMQPVVVNCESSRQELSAAVVWAKQCLKNNASATVAIVIPDLAQRRQTVERVLQEVFDPGYNQPIDERGVAADRRSLPYNFSAGYPLMDAPIITAAINALSLSGQSLELETLNNICQSPFYCADDVDLAAMTQLITKLFEQREYTLSAQRFRQLALKAGVDIKADSPWAFAEALQQQATISRTSSIGKSRLPGAWLVLFGDLLTAIGWPGQRSLDSIEYQQLLQWQQALDEFAALDLLSQPMDFSEALSQLRAILSRQVFQPQSADSSLQILGTLEAAGLQFDYLWLMSMSEQQWPASPAPNPLLPYSLQRELSMPHATAQRELDYASNLSRRFADNAKQLVVSYPQLLNDNPASISSLFSHYPTKTVTELLGRPLEALAPLVEIRRRHFESGLLEAFSPGNAPALLADETVKGGSSLFASQSACPFRAFARHRLNLRSLPEAELGLNAADRGSLLHRALELLWEKLKSQQALLALDESEQQTLCADITAYCVTEFSQRKPSRLGARYQALENTRLQQLLRAWLDVERSRANFVVLSTEERKSFQFNTLKLQTRIDRIDRLDDGSLLIIDYKTGSSSISRWWGERPDEPQMPLYSLLVDNQQSDDGEEGASVGGITFAEVRIDGCMLKGVGAEALPEPAVQWQDKIKTAAGALDWPQLKQQWQRVLTALANDFVAGTAEVNPKQSPQTCQYCDLATVCRINHQPVPVQEGSRS